MAEAFFRAFDRSLFEQYMGLPTKVLNADNDLLGEGAHFTAWRLRGTALVLKRAKPVFGKADTPQVRTWLAALRQAIPVGGLLPPLEVLITGDSVGLVMPYGAGQAAAAAPAWLPLTEQLQEFNGKLAAIGLELGDVPQIRVAAGVPFIVDLSDLRTVKSR